MKDLQNEFPGIRIYIQKEEYNGYRIAVLSYVSTSLTSLKNTNNSSTIDEEVNDLSSATTIFDSSTNMNIPIIETAATTITTAIESGLDESSSNITSSNINISSSSKSKEQIDTFLLQCKERIMTIINLTHP